MSGAIGDIQQVTKLARRMVTMFGMSERLGPIYFRNGEEHVFLGKEIHEGRDYSEGTARIIDEEIQRIVNEALTTRRPRARYVVGLGPKLQAALVTNMPTALRDQVLSVMTRMPRRPRG